MKGDVITSVLSRAALVRKRWQLSDQFRRTPRPGSGLAGVVCAAILAASLTGSTSAGELVHTTAVLSQARGAFAATAVGHRAFFAGGGAAGNLSDVVDIYDADTDMWSTATLSQGREMLAATTVGSKALFAGGKAGENLLDVVDIFDADTGTWSTATLSAARTGLAATTVGSKAFFAAGGGSNVVDIYDADTDSWSATTLSQARIALVGTTVGSKAVFAGGYAGGLIWCDAVDVYDVDTGLWATATLSEGRDSVGATAIRGSARPWSTKALFGGGYFVSDDYRSQYSDVVDIYDIEAGDPDDPSAWSTATLSVGRVAAVAVTVGNQAVFAGGFARGAASDVVDIYLEIFAGDRNGDGFVGQGDLDIVLAMWGKAGASITDPRADTNDDSFVGQYDLDTVLNDWGCGTLPDAPVPEPATVSLLGVGGLASMRRRRPARSRRVRRF